MSLRKERSHYQGLSNIDFRSKNDLFNMELFDRWKFKPNFGTMGYKNYERSYSSKKQLFKPSKKINTQKDIVNDYPDPRFYTTTQFYKKNNIDLNMKNIFTNERVAQLEETFKGKEPFLGDSMMISDINKQRKLRKKKIDDINDNEEKKMVIKNNIIKDKDEKNKAAIQETQLVKIDAKDTLEDKVNIDKLREIRLALRRRYANRSNFSKIFKEWAKSANGEITLYDAYDMINKLSIPVNLNEVKLLINSSNTRGTETLNLSEFMNLIFSDNKALLNDINLQKNRIYNEDDQKTLKEKMEDNIKEIEKTEELNQLKSYLRLRLPKFITYINQSGSKNGFCDYETFNKAINKFNMPINYKKQPILTALYNKFLDKNNLLNITELSNFLIEDIQPEYLSYQKDRIHEKALKNIKNREKELYDFIKNNNDKYIKNKQKILDLDNQIKTNKILKENEEKEYELKHKNEINNTVPSTPWINQVFKDHKKYFLELNNVESNFRAVHRISTATQPNTRFGSVPKWRDTSLIIHGNKDCPSYTNEIDRFNVRGNYLTEIPKLEKEDKKRLKQLSKQKYVKLWEKADDVNKLTNYLIEEKNKFSQYHIAKMNYDYNNFVKLQNKIIE